MPLPRMLRSPRKLGTTTAALMKRDVFKEIKALKEEWTVEDWSDFYHGIANAFLFGCQCKIHGASFLKRVESPCRAILHRAGC